MRQNTRSGDAPSRIAASSRSRGIDRKNWRRKKIPKPDIRQNGATIPAMVLSQPRSLMRMKFGMKVTTPGTIIDATNSPNSRSRPGKRSRANAYAAIALVSTCIATMIPVNSSELPTARTKCTSAPEPPIARLSSCETRPSTRVKLRSVGVSGQSWAAWLNTSCDGVSAVFSTTHSGITVRASIASRHAQAKAREGLSLKPVMRVLRPGRFRWPAGCASAAPCRAPSPGTASSTSPTHSPSCRS